MQMHAERAESHYSRSSPAVRARPGLERDVCLALARALAAHQGAKALVLLAPGRAALQVRAQAGGATKDTNYEDKGARLPQAAGAIEGV
jgi:hypothetical protein